MKLYDRRIGFLFCGILTVCTARIFHAKCPTSCDDKTTKYSAFTLIIHADREKSTRFHAFNHQFLILLHEKCIKQLYKSASADAEQFCLVFAVMILVKRKGEALAEIRREHLSPERRPLGGAVYLYAPAERKGKVQVCLWADT